MSHVTSDVGAKIKQARLAKHLSQIELGRLVGVGRKTVGNWENRGQLPTKAQAQDGLRTVLGLTLEELGHNPTMGELLERLVELQGQLLVVQETQTQIEARVRALEDQ